MTATCARTLQPLILLPLKRKGIAESLRNRRELREHRVHESDYRVIGARLRQRSERGEERCRPAYQAKVSILQCLNVVNFDHRRDCIARDFDAAGH